MWAGPRLNRCVQVCPNPTSRWVPLARIRTVHSKEAWSSPVRIVSRLPGVLERFGHVLLRHRHRLSRTPSGDPTRPDCLQHRRSYLGRSRQGPTHFWVAALPGSSAHHHTTDQPRLGANPPVATRFRRVQTRRSGPVRLTRAPSPGTTSLQRCSFGIPGLARDSPTSQRTASGTRIGCTDS